MRVWQVVWGSVAWAVGYGRGGRSEAEASVADDALTGASDTPGLVVVCSPVMAKAGPLDRDTEAGKSAPGLGDTLFAELKVIWEYWGCVGLAASLDGLFGVLASSPHRSRFVDYSTVAAHIVACAKELVDNCSAVPRRVDRIHCLMHWGGAVRAVLRWHGGPVADPNRHGALAEAGEVNSERPAVSSEEKLEYLTFESLGVRVVLVEGLRSAAVVVAWFVLLLEPVALGQISAAARRAYRPC